MVQQQKKQGKGIVRAGHGNKILELILKYKSIIAMSLDLMMLILEIIYQK